MRNQAMRKLIRWRAKELLTFAVTVFVLSISAMLTVVVVTFGGLYYYYHGNQRILPGVSVGRVTLGGLTISEAAIHLHEAYILEGDITAMDGLHTWQLTPQQLGLRLDALETARQAYLVGRGYSFFGEIGQMVYSLRNGWQIPPVVTWDASSARATLERLNAQVTTPAQNATFRLESGRLVAVAGKLGYALNIEEAMQELASDPGKVLTRGFLRVPLMPLAPQVNDLTPVLAQAEKLIAAAPRLYVYDPVSGERAVWDIPLDELVNWMQTKANGSEAQLDLDISRLSAYLKSLEGNLGAGRWIDTAKTAPAIAQAILSGEKGWVIVNHHPGRYTVRPGDTLLKIGWEVGIPYWMILRANPGLDAEQLSVGQELVIPSKDELLPLPVVANKRIILSIRQQRLWAYQDDKLVAKHLISTGIDRSPTQPGIFQVQFHEPKAYASIWNLTMPNFLGIYEAWPGFYNGIHGLPILANGRKLWANILGKPASFGCIILDDKAARWLYDWAENGVVVEIQP